MNDQPDQAKENRERAVRTASIDLAIRATSGTSYNDEGRMITDPQKIITAATMFEKFIKGA